MELSAETTALLTSPTVIGLAVAAFLGWIVATGLAMKFAVGLVAPETPTLRRALFIVVALTSLNVLVGVATALFVPPAYGIIANIVLLVVYLKIFGMMAKCSMSRAFMASVLYSIFAFIGSMLVFGGTLGAFHYAVATKHPEQMKELATFLKQHAKQANPTSGLASGEPADPGFDVRNVFFAGESEQGESASGFFSDGSGFRTGSGSRSGDIPATTPGGSSTRPRLPGGGLQIEKTFDTSNQQTNPFVK